MFSNHVFHIDSITSHAETSPFKDSSACSFDSTALEALVSVGGTAAAAIVVKMAQASTIIKASNDLILGRSIGGYYLQRPGGY